MYISSRVVSFLLSSVGNNIIKISFLTKLILCVYVVGGGAIDKYKSNMIVKIYSVPVSGKY